MTSGPAGSLTTSSRSSGCCREWCWPRLSIRVDPRLHTTPVRSGTPLAELFRMRAGGFGACRHLSLTPRWFGGSQNLDGQADDLDPETGILGLVPVLLAHVWNFSSGCRCEPDGFQRHNRSLRGGVSAPRWPAVGHLLLSERQLTESFAGVELVG